MSKSRIVILRLSSDKLADFPSTPAVKLHEAADKSDSNGTPVPNGNGDDPKSLAPPKGDPKKKKGAANPTGKKRAPPSIDPNGPLKERVRPGPKKKPKLVDGTVDRASDPAEAGKPVATVPAHKLGPKANTGAINAGLRALDRSGKPCRKWQRKGLQIKSFTGLTWGMSTWKAPLRNSFSGEVKSDSSASADSDAKPHNESSVVASDRSHADANDTIMSNGIESSPAPAIIPI